MRIRTSKLTVYLTEAELARLRAAAAGLRTAIFVRLLLTELLRRRDASTHDSPAAPELADFLKAWRANPEKLRLECEILEDEAALAAKEARS